MPVNIVHRNRRLHLNDPRCYNGAYFDAEYVWGPWETLERDLTPERAQDRLKFWQELNDYAVSQRGESAKTEFKIQAQIEKDLT